MFEMNNKNVFQKADYIRRLCKKALNKDLGDKELLSILARADSFNKGVTKTIPGYVYKALEELQAKGINTNTAFKYVKFSMVPTHIKEQVYNRKISIKRGIDMCKNAEVRRTIELEKRIFDLGIQAIQDLNQEGDM